MGKQGNRRQWGLKALILFCVIPVIIGTGVLSILVNYLMALESANHRIKDHIKSRRTDMNFIAQLPTLNMFIVDLRLGLEEEAAFFKQDAEIFIADYLRSLSPPFSHTLRIVALDGQELLHFENGRAVPAVSGKNRMAMLERWVQMGDHATIPLPDHDLTPQPDQHITDILPLYNEINRHLVGGIVFEYGIPFQELMSPVKYNLTLNILLAVATVFTILLVTYWVLELNIKPLRHLTSLAQNMIDGDLSKPVELKGKGETRILADSFETMRRQLKQQIDSLIANARQLARSLDRNKHIQEQLKDEKAYSDHILQGSPNLVCGVSPSGIIKFINPAGERISGYAARELLGKAFQQTLFKGRRNLVFEHLFNHPTEKQLHNYECDLATRVGEIRTLLWSSFGRNDDQGRIREIILIANDVTDRKAAEHEVRKFRTISDRSNYGSAIYDLDRRLTYINDAYAAMHGYLPDELIGKPQAFFFGAEFEAEEKRLLDILSRQGYLSAEETVHIHRKGHAVPVLLNSMLVKDDHGNPLFLSETVIDISEKKLLEEQLQIRQRMDSLGTLAGGIAHDFNNLLAGISGYLQLLMAGAGNFTQKQHHYFGQLSTSVHRATELIRQFQTLSHGSISKKQQVDLCQIAVEVFNMLDNATDRLIQKQNLIAPERFFVTGNHTELSQVFLNLGVNANEAIEANGANPEDYIRIKAEHVSLLANEVSTLDAGKYVYLQFEDSGCGMSETVKTRAFDPLYSSKKKGPRKGQGLGLAMVFNIIKNHRGHVTIDSVPGGGTTFHIYLPSVDAVPEETAPDLEMLPGTETILYVDDEDMLRPLIRETFEPLGYNVMTAADGAQGLELYKHLHEKIDIVILDLIMPRLSGVMLFEEIMSIHPEEKILIVSGQSEGQLPDAMRRRVKGFLAKPPSMAKLSVLLRKALDS